MALLGQPGASRKLWTLLKPEGLLTGVSSAGRGAGSPGRQVWWAILQQLGRTVMLTLTVTLHQVKLLPSLCGWASSDQLKA